MHNDDEEEGSHDYDLWSEDFKTRRHREWQENYGSDADLSHDAELAREIEAFRSGQAIGAWDADTEEKIARALVKRGADPERVKLRRETRAAQTASDRQSGTDRDIRTLHYVEGSPEFEYDTSDRRQLSDLEITHATEPQAFNERGLVSLVRVVTTSPANSCAASSSLSNIRCRPRQRAFSRRRSSLSFRASKIDCALRWKH